METVVASNEGGGEIFELHDVLGSDEEDPSTKAARKMDWESFMSALSSKDQAIIQFMIEGNKCSTMARKLGVCSSTIQHRKQSLAKAIVEFMGPDILLQVQCPPRWKQDLEATREKLACKHERSH